MFAGLLYAPPTAGSIVRANFLGGGEMLVILFIALLIFGGSRLPQLAQGLGKSIREFKREMNRPDEQAQIDVSPPKEIPADPSRHADAQKRS